MTVFLRTILVVTLLLGAVGQSGCTQNSNSFSQVNSNDESMSDNEGPYYYLDLDVQDARTQTIVNGVGFHEGDGRTGLSLNAPMNALLIGTDNSVTVIVKPTTVPAGDPPKSGKLADADSVRPSTVADAEVSVAIDKVTSGTVTPEGGETLAEKTLEEVVEKKEEALQKEFLEKLESAPPEKKKALADREEELTRVELPVEMELTFDSEDVPSFRERFVEAPVIEDTSVLKDFAIRLRDLAKNKSTRRLFELSNPKFQIYATAYPSQSKSEQDDLESFLEVFEEKYYGRSPFLEFDREDLVLKKWAGGRVWEINVDRGEALEDSFFLSRLDGEVWTMDIFVGKVDGELKVVR